MGRLLTIAAVLLLGAVGAALAWTPDFVIVGAGNSGCVLAAGLAKFKHTKVLLISEGFEEDYVPADNRFMSWWTTSIPATNPVYVGDNPANEPVLSNENSGFANNVRQYSPRCPIPGGCSGTNGQTWDVNADDYWNLTAAYVGDARWAAPNMREQRKWTESYQGVGNVACHGTHGGINLSAPNPEPTGIAIMNALAANLSIPLRADTICADSNVGVGATARNIDANGYVRQNTYFELVKPIYDSQTDDRLRVEFGAVAIDLVTKNSDATVVKCLDYVDSSGQTQRVCPNSEILLTMGGIGTPRFLFLNGIGPCSQLASVGVSRCLVDNANVGQHIRTQAAYVVPLTANPEARVPMSTVMSHYFSDSAKARGDPLPNLMIASGQILQFDSASVILAILQLTRPQDEGFMRLQSAYRHTPVFLSYNIGLNHPEDITDLAGALLQLRNVIAEVNKAGYTLTETGATVPLVTLAQIRNALVTTQLASENWHHVGSVRMGKAGDSTAVADSEGHIFGLTGVRVADNSLMVYGHPGHASQSGARDVGVVILQMVAQQFGLAV